MTIRTRLSLWYAGVLLAALLVVGVPSRLTGPPGVEPGVSPGPSAADRSPASDAAAVLLRVAIPGVFAVVVGGWWLMRRTLAPIQALTRAIERTSEGNLRERLPRSGNGDELDRLAEVFNAMTARLDESFQRIRDFTLHASHELKTPLTVMRGEIETACRDGSLTDGQRDCLASQLDEVQRLAAIVDNLSLLTRADAGLVTLARSPESFDDLVRETVEDLQHLAAGRSVAVNLARCDRATVVGDRHRLRQMLLNLADNAVKFNEPGGRVEVSLCRGETDVEFRIANTGPGVPAALQSRVFERFFRGDSSRDRSVEGSGLGLCLVQWIVEVHGGTVALESEVGRLTTVSVRLPAVLS